MIESPEMHAPSSNGAPAREARPRPLTVQSFGSTDRGRERPTNEDQFVNATLLRALWIEQSSVPQSAVHYADERGHLFVVADGMGGAAAGEMASALAVGAVEQFLLNALRWVLTLDGVEDASVLRDFQAALRSADARVCEAATSDPELRGMGTTLTMAYSLGAELFVAHVGDSRCYLLRDGRLRRLTHDHTLVREMIAGGLITPEQAADHELRHVITNVVGGPLRGVRVEVRRVPLVPGDTVLLCTDGLTGMVSDAQIAAILQESRSPQMACEELTLAANAEGGRDNVTVIVARYA